MSQALQLGSSLSNELCPQPSASPPVHSPAQGCCHQLCSPPTPRAMVQRALWCVGRRHAAWDVATLPAVALHVPHQPRALHVLPLECPPPAPAAWPPCPLNFMSCRAGSLSVSYQACVLTAASLAAIKAHVSPLGWESGGEGRGLSCCWWLECSCSPKAFL